MKLIVLAGLYVITNASVSLNMDGPNIDIDYNGRQVDVELSSDPNSFSINDGVVNGHYSAEPYGSVDIDNGDLEVDFSDWEGRRSLTLNASNDRVVGEF